MFSELVLHPVKAVANQTRNRSRAAIRDEVDARIHDLVWDRMVWPAVRQTWDWSATPVISRLAASQREPVL